MQKKSLPEEPAHQRNSSKTHIKNMPTLKTTILVCVWVPWQTYAVLQRNTSVFASCLAFILVYIFSRKSWERSMKQRRVHWPRRNAIHTRDGVGFNHYTYFMKQSHIKKVLYTPTNVYKTPKSVADRVPLCRDVFTPKNSWPFFWWYYAVFVHNALSRRKKSYFFKQFIFAQFRPVEYR